MKFICSVIINSSKNNVAKLFGNPDFLGEYQDGFLRKKHISGEAGKEGSISKMYYKMGKGEMELTETILKNELPNSFSAFYFHKHTENTMTSTFITLDENITELSAEIDYTALKGFMVKIIAFLFPSFFKKQVQKWLKNFKVFVEKQSNTVN
ncbi:MAG: hypothetical protein V3V28_03345 [Polaribacter sp.]|uniref:hypothetical protein n=1 Tax=Polaribacter sp. TaxID=1920175 RepID=UPI002F3580DC